jgi:molybdopterin-guanine dinucleotide biosynthesis protein A
MFKTAALITAAGSSTRMGSHKALLKYNQSLSFLDKLIETYSEYGCKKIVITLNNELFNELCNYKNEKVLIVLNNKPELERLYSIQLGLQTIENYDFCFVQSIDNPFTQIQLLTKLFTNKKNDFYIVPTIKNKGGHPVLINKMIIDYICKIDTYNLKFNDVLKQFKRESIEVDDESIFYNINTMETYQQLIR